MRSGLLLGIVGLIVMGGCPQNGSPVTAVIGVTTTSGDAPLTVTFTASGSSSANGGPLTYSWQFDDGGTSTAEIVEHTFQNPGRYTVRLTATDSTRAEDTAAQIIRAAGTSATAVITTDVNSGAAPLLVAFDASSSVVPDDTIYDYFWDFGDGEEAREASPSHLFQSAGTYTVTLRIVTAGGLEDTTTTTITVGERVGSLQFAGSDFATLPLASARTLATFTFEAWVNAESSGGTVATLGAGAMTIELLPSTNTIRLQVNGVPTDGTTTNLASGWRHVAAVYDGIDDGSGNGNATLYLDGVALVSSTPPAGDLTIDEITLGVGFQGNIAEVRFWTDIRTAAEIDALMDQRAQGTEANLLCYYELSAGSGQTLTNRGSDGTAGVLGATDAVENTDPAWGTDGPPLQ